jgi:hypothetical protein
MPSLNLQTVFGSPRLDVIIGVSLARAKALDLAGKSIPAHKRGVFLIDTGASGTCIDPGIIGSLAIPQSGSVEIETPSTAGKPCLCAQYDVSIYIPNDNKPPLVIDALPVLETDLKAQGIDGLLGRDVLSRCVFIFNPEIQLFTLTY